jgi:DNA polymerase-3 subunit delta
MSINLVRGVDPILRDDAVDGLVRDLLGDDDRTLALEEIVVPGRAAAEGEVAGSEGRTAAVDAAVNAASTPPFMTARRIVVVRDIGNLTKDEAAPLVEYVADPAPTTELVLVMGGGASAKTLEDAVKKHGVVTSPVSERAADVLERELDATGLALRGDARDVVLAHVGGDAGLLPGMVETLTAVHGAGARLGVDEITPYLGEAGTAPSWDLTNAIERGDVAGALGALQRMLTVTSPTQPRPMHPLQVMGMLHGHYRRLLRLDDPAIRSNEDAAAALGARTNPRSAGFRLRQTRALGADGLREAFDHLARADLDLKGERAIPSDAVMQVLVARLAGLTARRVRSRH